MYDTYVCVCVCVLVFVCANDILLVNWCSSIFGHQVFVCGAYPHWLFMSERGALRCHPMSIDGPVVTFSSFHNVNCKKGFLYFNNEVQFM